MKRIWHMEDDTSANNLHTHSSIGGTGSASILHMTDEEREKADKRKRPVGFVVNEQSGQNRRS